MPFSKMAQWLSPAKVDFACSADYLGNVDVLNFTAEQQALLKDIPDAMFKQTVRDFIVGQNFRKDYWIKGGRHLSVLEQTEGLKAQKLMLIRPRADVSLKVSGALGEANMQEAIYNPILDVLADHKPYSLGQIELLLKPKNIAFGQIIQAVMILSGPATLCAVQDDDVILNAKKFTDKLNAYLMDKARGSADVITLASPVTGGGIGLGRVEQLFLLALSQGKKLPTEWVQFTWQILASQGQKIVKEGKPLESLEENLAEITTQANLFAEKELPILKALQIA
jgi:hypothetical protein